MKKLVVSLISSWILAACGNSIDEQIEGGVLVTESEPMGIEWIMSNLWPDFQIASMCWNFISETMEFLELPLDDVQWLNRTYPFDTLNQTQSIISAPALGLQLNESEVFQHVFLKVTPVSMPETFKVRENSIRLVMEVAGFDFIADIVGHEDERKLPREQWQYIVNGIVEIIKESSEEMRLQMEQWREAERLDREQGNRETLERMKFMFSDRQQHIIEEMPFAVQLFAEKLRHLESNWNHPYNPDPRQWEDSHRITLRALDEMPIDYEIYQDIGQGHEVLSFVQIEIRDELDEEIKLWTRIIKLGTIENISTSNQSFVHGNYYLVTNLSDITLGDILWQMENN